MIFNSLFGGNFNTQLKVARETKGAVIVDVRTPMEFKQGHVEGARNIPLDAIGSIQKHIADKEAPVYLYCASGARSGSALRELRRMGYTNVVNMGGIGTYSGPLARGNN